MAHPLLRRALRRELATINRRSKAIMELLPQRIPRRSVEARTSRYPAAKGRAGREISTAAAEPVGPMLHPNMAAAFQEKVTQLAAALEHKGGGALGATWLRRQD